MMRRRIGPAAALVLAAAIASPAAAIDSLTGVWRGKQTCEGATPAATAKGDKAEMTIFLEDHGDGTGGVRVNNAIAETMPIAIVSGADKPEQAYLMGFTCDFDLAVGGIL